MQKINFKNKPSTDSPVNADNLNLLQDNVEEAIDIVDMKLDEIKSTTLWENANLSNNFEAQTISLNLSNFDKIELIFSEGQNSQFNIGNSGYVYVFQDANGNFTGNPYVYLRRIVVTISSVEIGDCRGQNTSQSGTWATNNARLKLKKIIGYKKEGD